MTKGAPLCRKWGSFRLQMHCAVIGSHGILFLIEEWQLMKRWKHAFVSLVVGASMVSGVAWAAPSKRVLKFDILSGKKKIGFVETRETFKGDEVVVKGTSSTTFRVMFWKIVRKVSFTSYFKKNKLTNFSIHVVQRGKHTRVKATRTAKGYKVIHTAKGKTRTKLFPFSDFDATSREYRLPVRAVGSTLQRRILNFLQFKVLVQNLKMKAQRNESLLGKTVAITEVVAKSKKGKATLFVTKEGAVIRTAMKVSMLGSFGMVLKKVEGRSL